MKKTTILVILALIGAVSKAEGQVNPKISQLFEEVKATKGRLFRNAPSIVKRGGKDTYETHSELAYSLNIYYRPDLIRGGKDSQRVDSMLREEKAVIDKQVKAILRTIAELQKEAQDSLHYESHKDGKDTIFYSMNLSKDTTRVYKSQVDNRTYYYSDEFLEFCLESGEGEGAFKGHFNYTVYLPCIDLYSGTYTWGNLNDDVENLFNEHGVSHRNAFWQHDDAYSRAVWDDTEAEDRLAWISIFNYGEDAYAGVTEAKIYSLTEDQKPLAQQLLAVIDSLALKFTNCRQSRHYEYYYGASLEGSRPTILAVYNRHMSETNSIQVRVANHGYHFLILNTRGVEWIPTEWLTLKSFINGKKEYFE